MADAPAPIADSESRLGLVIPAVVSAIGTAVGITVLAPRAWVVLILDGWLPATMLVSAAGWGAWPVRWLGLGRRPQLQQVLLAIAIGLGLLSTASLILGVAGIMQHIVALILIGGGVAAGLLRIADTGQRSEITSENHLQPISSAAKPSLRLRWTATALQSLVLLPLAFPAAIMLVGATLPPGLLWIGEANGYDVLEYHLQAPREYFDAGRITLLPHNVYASFPQQMEMLYYLLMHLGDGPLAAAISSQLLHAALGLLFVLALAAWQPTRWAAVLAMVVGGSVPWIGYLGGLAYVELGMLFFAAVAAGLLLAPLIAGRPPAAGEMLAAGLCAGLAAGCKYQGVVMVAGALGLAWMISVRASAALRLSRGAVFALAALAAFSPWLSRNAAFTGNPVYPFAYGWLGGEAWSAAQAEQWQRGHQLPPEQATLLGRWQIAGRELWRGELFGPLPFVAALVGGVLAFGPRVGLLGVWAAVIFTAWVGFTHMPGRFAVPLVVPLALLAGGIATPRIVRIGQPLPVRLSVLIGLMIFVQASGAVANGRLLHQVYDRQARAWRERIGLEADVELHDMAGQTELLAQADSLNALATTPKARLWLVGRADVFYVQPPLHYTVVFSRDPWIALADGGASPAECIEWLRSRSVTHVVFSWREINRFRRTYGFSLQVSRDWVDRLAAAGLRRIGPAPLPDESPALEVFEVPPR